MKICIISEFCIPYFYGGGEFRYFFLAKELQKQGHDVTWVSMHAKIKWKKTPCTEVYQGIKLVHLGPTVTTPPKRNAFQFLHFMYATRSYLKKNSFDIIDAQAFSPLIPAYLHHKKRKTPMIATIHDVSDGKNDQWIQYNVVAGKIEKFLYSLSYPCIVTVSQSVKKRLEQKYPKQKNKVHVINNAVDLTYIDSIISKNKYKKKEYSLCFVGRLVENKRVQDLLDAVSLLQETFPLISLTIVGSGPQKGFLETQVRKKKLTRNVTFLSDVNDQTKFETIHKSDLFVSASVREGFGIVLVEAMACETAVIASRIDGFRNVVDDTVNGLLFEPRNVNDLVEKITLLLKKKKLRDTLILNAKNKIKQQYQWESKAKELATLYEKVIFENSN